MRLSLACLIAALAIMAAGAYAEEPAAAAAPAAAPAEAPTSTVVEEEPFAPNTIVQKHIGGDVLVLSVFSETKAGKPVPKTAEECQQACRDRKDCNAWLFCESLDGCKPGPGDACEAHLSTAKPKLPARFGVFGTAGGDTDPCVGEDHSRYPPQMCTLKKVADVNNPPNNDAASMDWRGGTIDRKAAAAAGKEAKAKAKADAKEAKAAAKADKPAAAPAPAAEEKPAAESKPDDAKPAESKPAESKPDDAKPAESKPAESKPDDDKPAAAGAAAAGAAAAGAGAAAAAAPKQPKPVACTDNPPPNGFSCEQQKGWGACDAPWMVAGGWCLETCGLCPGGGGAAAAPATEDKPAAAAPAEPAAAAPAPAPASAPPAGLTEEEKGEDGKLSKGGVLDEAQTALVQG